MVENLEKQLAQTERQVRDLHLQIRKEAIEKGYPEGKTRILEEHTVTPSKEEPHSELARIELKDLILMPFREMANFKNELITPLHCAVIEIALAVVELLSQKIQSVLSHEILTKRDV